MRSLALIVLMALFAAAAAAGATDPMDARSFFSQLKFVEFVEQECDHINYQSWGEATSPGLRRYQEDRVLVDGVCLPDQQNLGVFAVFDGHIGPQASEFLAANFKRELTEQIRLMRSDSVDSFVTAQLRLSPLESMEYLRLSPSGVKDAVTRALVALDAAFLKRAAQERIPAGSTACVVVMNKDEGYLVVSNVGDSRAMLCTAGSAEGKLQPVALTKDDLPTDRSECERIEASGGRVRNGVINGHFPMSRAIGDLPMRQYGVVGLPTTEIVEIKPGDGFLVIVSDGILEGMKEQEICRMIEDEARLSSHPVLIAESVLNKASLASSDNLSIIVVPL